MEEKIRDYYKKEIKRLSIPAKKIKPEKKNKSELFCKKILDKTKRIIKRFNSNDN